MRTSTRRIIRAVVAATAMALVMPTTAASADPGDSIHGGCAFITARNATLTAGQNNGVLAVAAEMLKSNGLPDAGAVVHCKIQVAGTDVSAGGWAVPANPAGLVQGETQISFDDQDGTSPTSLCEDDVWGDGDTSGWYCWSATDIQAPPPGIMDVLDSIEFNLLDPLVCPIFSQLGESTGGGVLGVIRIDPDGDLYLAKVLGVGYDLIYDCPPYGPGTGISVSIDPAAIKFALPKN